MTQTPHFQLRRVTVRKDGRTLLRLDGLDIQTGSIVGIAGHNGSGKSTLLRLLALLERPTQGELLVHGAPTQGREGDLRRQITLLVQEPYLFKRTVFENIAYGLRARGLKDGIRNRVDEALEWVGLAPGSFAQRTWRELSGGEAQRVALAARLVLKPQVLLLDEPTASLDQESTTRIQQAALDARRRWGSTLVLVSHDQDWLFATADLVHTLYMGRLAGTGRINVLPGWQNRDGQAVLDLGQAVPLQVPVAGHFGQVAVCPAHLCRVTATATAPDPLAWVARVTVLAIKHCGGTLWAQCRAGGIRLLAQVDPALASSPGQDAFLRIPLDAFTFLPD